VSERLLAVQGSSFWGAPVIGAMYLLGAPALLGLAWLALQLTGRDAPGYAPVVFVGLVVGFLILTGVVYRYAFPRQGGAEFFEDGVVVFKSWSKVETIPWDELASYSLPADDHVQLHRRGESGPDRRLTVPTPEPELRAQVIALLGARGVTRTG